MLRSIGRHPASNLELAMPSFTDRIRPYVRKELEVAAWAESWGRLATARHHLERAHVLGQASTREHVSTHVAMARMAIRHRRWREAAGQLWRTAAALVLTPLGLVPVGNPGGSNVSAFVRRAVPRDLQRLIDHARHGVPAQPDRSLSQPS